MKPPAHPLSRRHFLRGASLLSAAALLPQRVAAADAGSAGNAAPGVVTHRPVFGQGGFRYRQVPGWGTLDATTPVNNCHGLARDREGHIVLLTDEVANNVIIYDRRGRLVHKWGHDFPGAHGLSLVSEGAREVLFITDLKTHRVIKTSLDGTVLNEWRWPQETGKYEKEDQYRPSWTLHRSQGDFFVLDGYGRDYILQYDAAGKRVGIFGGAEGGIVHWGPHGGMIDTLPSGQDTLLIAMSDQLHLLRLSLSGEKLAQVDLPGGNPRQIRRHRGHFFVAHLADDWPRNRESRGFISVLDAEFRVVSNIGGRAPRYDDAGRLQKMGQEGDVFNHPHDLLVDDDESLYVAQFASGRTYPLKFERI